MLRPWLRGLLLPGLLLASLAVQAALPPGWLDADIGSPALPGSASSANGLWTISGGGADICNSDQMHFAWKTVSGDGQIVAHVDSIQNAAGAQAGIMFRNDTTAGGLEVAILATPGSGVSFQWRNAPGSGCYYQVVIGQANLGAPLWLKLVRAGNAFSGFWSTNNTDWAQVGSTQTVPLTQTALAGLVVSANNNAALASAGFSSLSLPQPIFGVYRELWTGLSPAAGNSLTALTNSSFNPNWPDTPNPDYTAVFASFETETNSGLSYYGQRLRAFVVPPRSGAYTFWIASDDTSELRLSPDETAGAATPIAWVSTQTAPREWTHEPNQQSAPVWLQAGQRYYVEARMQQGSGSDNLAVRWQLPDGTIEEPLNAWSSQGTRLIPCTGLELPPGIYNQPTNQTIADGADALMAVLVTNQSAVAYQWQLSGTNLAGAVGAVYVVSNANPQLNNNQLYRCVVSNGAGVVTSAVALLSVLTDSTPPTVARAAYLGPTNVQIVFSEALEAASATNVANYLFTNGLAVSQATLGLDNLTVTLTTAPLVFGSNYVIVLNGIRDRSSTHWPIATNTIVSMVASPYAPLGIGSPTPPGTIAGAGDGYDIGGGGRDISSTSDQFQFVYQAVSGDFDFKVRLKSLSQTDAFAKAGLMAREDLTAGARFAAVLATPGISGSFFENRSTAGGSAVSSASVPVNYPDTWLRLQRSGNQFTGYASYDGVAWQQLGSVSLALNSQIFFGMAVCSRSVTQLAVGQFRELSTVTNATTGVLPLPPEPPGPSSRRTGLAITEIMYHPAPRADLRRLEFIEIFNSQPYFEDISGFSISGDISFTFPPGTVLGAGACVVVAASPTDIQAVYGISNVLGPYTNNLGNASGTVRLRNKIRAVLLEVNYDSTPPWPVAADGAGHSLVLARPSYGEASPLAWKGSDRKGGSPGVIEGIGPEPARAVMINEFLAHTDLPDYDTIELFNSSTQAVDVSGCWLSDKPDTNMFRIPAGSIIPGRGFLVFDERSLGFRLNAAGQTIYFVNATDTRVLDAVRYEAQANGVSSGRWPDGAPTFRALAAKTLGTNNSPPLTPSIVINEIMYDPISGNDDDQFVELYNRSAARVDLSGWRFTAGISFTFPTNTTLAPDGYLVVARNRSRMQTNYANLNAGNLVGDFGGKLSHKGERLALAMPDQITSTNAHGGVSTNTIYIVHNEVTYGTGGRWGHWAHGGGSSLELINPRADNSLAPNWADSDETAKSAWTNIEYTGMLDLGNGYSPDQLQMFLLGEGECLVDNVEVFRPGEANRITNPGFTSGTGGWYFQGTHRYSSLESAGGYGGGSCLHVRASGHGDTGANRIRTVLSSSLWGGDTATLRAKVRWLKGWPEFLLRLHGNWLEATGAMPIPANLGTPGARNSRYVANAGPAIVEVSHSPALPAANQPVVVTARVSDPDGLGPVSLVYRVDKSGGGTIALPMVDDGTGGDAFAGDGIYSATLPGQNPGALIAFYIQATDRAATSATTTFPNDAPARECLVRFGEQAVPGSLGTYRLWLTQAKVNFWSSREKLSSDPVDGTFVYGNSRIIYNMGALYSGSPWHIGSFNSPTGNPCDYNLEFPDDDLLLGVNEFLMATPGNLDNDLALQREQAAFWMLTELGVPSCYRRFVVMYVNGSRRGPVIEDAQQPNGDQVAEFFPDDPNGHLHKIDDWFEFDDAASGFANVDATLDDFTSGGVKKAARYRWNWRPRAVQTSVNDFTNLFLLVDALHTPMPEPFTSDVESLVDVEGWMRTLALERFCGNWDSFGYNRGKNMYAYKPERGPWQLMAFDIDFDWDLGDGPTTWLFGGEDSSVNTMCSFPPFARAYWRAFQDIVDGPAQDTRLSPMLDAKYAALMANGISVSAPSPVKSYVTQRRSYIQSQLATVAATFRISSTTVTNNVAVITGTAPVKVKTIVFNGKEYPTTWNSVTGWTILVPLQRGSNAFTVLGLDSYGQIVSGTSNYVTAVCSTNVPSPAGQVVINEIMYTPATANAQYVELFNTSSNITFDLSGCEFRGLSYTFPPGSVIAPNKYLMLAADRVAFATTYGLTTPAFDVFNGALQTDGETLTLVQPGTNTASDVVISKVRFDSTAPWPAYTASTGSSLQVLDPRQDNWRAGNWAAVRPNSPAPPQWTYVTAQGTGSSSTLYIYLQSAGDIFLDDIKLVAGSVPESGTNLLPDGDFESGFPGPWTVSPNLTNSQLSTVTRHGGNASLHLVSTSAGSSQSTAIWQTISPALSSTKTYTLSFWYLQSTNGGPLALRLSGSGISTTINPAPPSINLALFTPGATNSVAQSLPAFPPLWINELEAENLTGITNRAGQRTPWLELYNPSTNAVSLNGLCLANSYTNLLAWSFPTNAVVNPGQSKVIFADGQTGLSTTNELHTSFTLAPGAGCVALSRLYNGQPQVLDYVNYTNLAPDRSYGSFPDGQSFSRQQFYFVTPGGTNNPSSRTLPVVINEWMADNTHTLADPADSDYEDWFELYNTSTNAVDLGGYFLTDTLTNKFQFEIPNNGQYVIPPLGFLLVWADGESKQNATNRADLHVNFKLDKAGEAIGLFGADGRLIDYVSFGPQLSDVSAGRYPDGSSSIAFLPAATPRAGNLPPNTPPLLSVISDQVIALGQTLRLAASATDMDQPPQTLTYSLGTSAPAGAAIDPISGWFTWTPTYGPGTNPVTVIVTDSGVPPLSATQTFNVAVLLPPRVESLSLSGNRLTFSWQTLAGQQYQVEFKDELDVPGWYPLGTPLTGTGTPLSYTNILDSTPQRFFRVRLAP